jgi:hypothetical protein
MFKNVAYNSLLAGIADANLPVEQASVLVRTKVAVPAIKQAVENLKKWKELAEKKQEECKKLIETTEAKVKQMRNPDWIPDIYTIGEVKGAVDILLAVAKHLKEQNEAYSTAFAKDGLRAEDVGKPITKNFPQITGKLWRNSSSSSARRV